MRAALARLFVTLSLLLCGATILLPQPPAQPNPQQVSSLEKWDKSTSVIEHVFTVLGIVAGGFWAYFNYFKGRTYQPRLEPKVTGKIIRNGETNMLITTSQLKNVGLSTLSIQQEGSAVRIFEAVINSQTSEIQWKRLKTISVFAKHRWIESGEKIEDQELIPLPKVEPTAIKIELRIISRKIEWGASSIIQCRSPNGVRQES